MFGRPTLQINVLVDFRMGIVAVAVGRTFPSSMQTTGPIVVAPAGLAHPAYSYDPPPAVDLAPHPASLPLALDPPPAASSPQPASLPLALDPPPASFCPLTPVALVHEPAYCPLACPLSTVALAQNSASFPLALVPAVVEAAISLKQTGNEPEKDRASCRYAQWSANSRPGPQEHQPH